MIRDAEVARHFKRAAEVFAAACLLIPAVPIVLIAALLIRARSTGPSLLVQLREGKHGVPFAMLKLRTMYVNADAMLAELLETSDAARQEWVRYRRLASDPRVVPGIGRLVRRFSVDELPQLWNVLRGEMSLVGPRPLELEVAARMPEHDIALRRTVRPGMTGAWQVSGRSQHDISTLCAMDRQYLERWSLWSDIRILMRTPAAVLSRRGAY